MGSKDFYNGNVFIDMYATLGVDNKSSQADIVKAYRGLARELHPDRHPNANSVQQSYFSDRFTFLTKCKDVLCNEYTRRAYDREVDRVAYRESVQAERDTRRQSQHNHNAYSQGSTGGARRATTRYSHGGEGRRDREPEGLEQRYSGREYDTVERAPQLTAEQAQWPPSRSDRNAPRKTQATRYIVPDRYGNDPVFDTSHRATTSRDYEYIEREPGQYPASTGGKTRYIPHSKSPCRRYSRDIQRKSRDDSTKRTPTREKSLYNTRRDFARGGSRREDPHRETTRALNFDPPLPPGLYCVRPKRS